MKNNAESTTYQVNELMKSLRINEVIEETMQFIRSVNKYLEKQAPWILIKEDKKSAGRVLITASESLRIGAKLLQPIMPNRTKTLLDTFGTGNAELGWGQMKPGNTLKKHNQLFPRIEIRKNSES